MYKKNKARLSERRIGYTVAREDLSEEGICELTPKWFEGVRRANWKNFQDFSGGRKQNAKRLQEEQLCLLKIACENGTK